jgi:tetratricopeptide (TPR) repeat protein
VTKNALLTAADGLQRIWFSLDSPSQYFPLVYSAFRLEHRLWGLDPLGYHLVNVLLHAMNAVLFWWVLRRLAIPGAWFAAALFALHPVQVESVAWISERKNVLSTLFYLLTVLAWLKSEAERQDRPTGAYCAALGFYALALFSKTTVVTLPVVLLLLSWYRMQPINAKRLLRLAPFVLMAIAMGLVTVWWEVVHQGTKGPEFDFTLGERAIIAGRAVWFYLGKLLWPAQLTFSYPRWEISQNDPAHYVWVLTAVGCSLAVWRWRSGCGRGPALGLAFFAVSLLPILGFISLYTFKYTFVADHYQYLACGGPLAILAGFLRRRWRSAALGVALGVVLPAIILVACGALTWKQARIYETEGTLWRDTLAKNPGSWMAHNNYGLWLATRGQFSEAVPHYEAALRIVPVNTDARYNLGLAFESLGRYEEANLAFREVTRINPRDAQAFVGVGNTFARLGRPEEARAAFRTARGIKEAADGRAVR